MEGSGLRRLWYMLMVWVWLAGLTHCGIAVPDRSRTAAPARSPAQQAAEASFAEAERAFREGDYQRARPLYQGILTNYPQSTLPDAAAFRLTEILYYEQQYEAAAEAAHEFLRHFPRSHLMPDAAYVQGLSLTKLKRFAEARAALELAHSLLVDPRRQGQVALALAEISVAEGQRARAVEELRILVEGQQVPPEVRQQARELGIQVVNQQLTPAELEALKGRWPAEFPTDYILLRQANEAWRQQQADRAEAMAKEFLAKFPAHPEAPQMHTLLATIEQARSIAVDKHKIGVVLPLSSPRRREWVSEVGQSALQGIQVAFAREGFSPLKMEVRDSKADLGVTASVVDELITTQRVIALVGPVFNETTQVAAKKALHYRVPLITPGAPSLDWPSDNPYVIRTSLTNRLEAQRMAEYAIGNLGLRRMAILYPDDAAGRELADTFHQRVSEWGGEVVTRVAYAPNQVDFTPSLRQLGGQTDAELRDGRASAGGASAASSAEPQPSGRLPYEAIYLPRSFERLQYLGPAMALYNMTGVTLLGESGWNHPELVRRAGAFVEGAVFMDGFFADSAESSVQSFVQSYRTMFKAEPDLMAAQSYDAMLMLLSVLKRRPETREEVREALRGLRDFRGATGRSIVLPDGALEKRLFALTVRRGQIVQLN
jgi:branched-chain amino acid transport system substrate-binding protein